MSLSLLSWCALLLLCWCTWQQAGVVQAVRAPEQWSGQSTSRVRPARPEQRQANVVADEGRQGPQLLLLQRPEAAPEQQQQRGAESHDARGRSAGAAAAPSSRHLTQLGPMMPDFPADLSGLDSLLAAARDAFTFFEPRLPATYAPAAAARRPRPQPASGRALGTAGGSGAGSSIVDGGQARAPGAVTLQVAFASMQPDLAAPLRLPPPPRAFNLTVTSADGQTSACRADRLPYMDQAVDCQGLRADGTTPWVATLVDADADGLVLAAVNFTLALEAASQDVTVQLGMLSVEAAFGELAWAGLYYPRPQRASSAAIIIHAQIVGAQIRVFTQQNGVPVVWDVQWTGDDGTASFFLVPGARNTFFANMSVGETVLRTAPLMLESPGGGPDGSAEPPTTAQSALQQQQLVAVPQLLCTGEVEDVRGESGTFPQSLSALEASTRQAVYHPRGFVCRWELVPEQPDVLLSIDYRGLLPDEAITLILGPNNIIQLTRPPDSPGAVYQASLWVERSILVAFQSTRTSTSKVGAFSVSWTSISSGNRGVLDSKTMVVVLACVSAAGAVLAACCFYFVCCGRRRRAASAVVDAGGTELQLMRVPSAVRSLLPSKPYQAPENPLPGAATEPDCCSVCLVEFEPAEHVTVLPCMHFYHKECIGSWLKRNCTCPLCKSNVLEAFKVQQHEARQAARRLRRQRSSTSATPPPGLPSPAAAAAGADGRSRSGSSAAAALQGGQELGAVQLASPGAAAAAAAAAAQQGGRAGSPWAPLESPVPSPAPAVLAPGGGYAVAAALAPPPAAAVAGPSGLRGGRLPPLPRAAAPGQEEQPAAADGASDGGSSGASADLAVHVPLGPTAAAAAGVLPLVIPPSPSPSYASLQFGTVHATPLDFAPAAAAAAAALAQQRRLSPPTTPGAIADAALSAASASVAALRSSSRNLGRRLQGLVSPRSRAVSPTGSSEPAGASRAGSRSASPEEQHQQQQQGLPGIIPAGPLALAGAMPLLPGSGGSSSGGMPRLAVSIYALAADVEEEGGQAHQGAGSSPQAGSGGVAAGARAHQAITVADNLPGSVESPHQRQQQQQR